MEIKRLQFVNRNGQGLAAQLDLPDGGKPSAYALFAHCFTCTKNLKAVAHISRSLNREGIAVLRFDFTGLGQSEGDFADTNFTTNVSDLVDAAQFLADNYEGPDILIGHSFGGAAVLQAASEIASAKAVAVIAAPAKADHVLKHFSDAKQRIEKDGEAEVTLDGRAFRIKKQFIDDLSTDRMAGTIENLERALLILHSPVDNTVGIENASAIFQAAKHPKSFISLDTADHLLTDPADSQYAGKIIAAWARKYIALPDVHKTQKQSADNPVVVQIGETGYTTEITAGGHSMIADEPESSGGTDMGPTPYNYLAAGLGACKAITLRMYADRKQWPLKAVRISLSHRKIHADDCRDCETKKGYLDRIEAQLALEGDLDADQRQRLLEIADKCPVHRTLKGEIRIDTKLED